MRAHSIVPIASEKRKMRLQITEYLDIDLAEERWRCNRCGADLGDARDSYKKGCLVRDRHPHEIHFPIGPSKEFNFSLDPKWMRIVEFYCPGCGVMVENEYLPPGHPLTWDIQLDIDKLKKKYRIKGNGKGKGGRAGKGRARAASKKAKPSSAAPRRGAGGRGGGKAGKAK